MENQSFFLRKSIPYEEDSIESTLQYCEKAILGIVQDRDSRFRLNFAIHELIINALEHGYHKHPGEITVSVVREASCIFLEVCDAGSGIDKAALDIENEIGSLEDAGKRGWGLHIINKLFQDMEIVALSPRGTKVSMTLQL